MKSVYKTERKTVDFDGFLRKRVSKMIIKTIVNTELNGQKLANFTELLRIYVKILKNESISGIF